MVDRHSCPSVRRAVRLTVCQVRLFRRLLHGRGRRPPWFASSQLFLLPGGLPVFGMRCLRRPVTSIALRIVHSMHWVCKASTRRGLGGCLQVLTLPAAGTAIAVLFALDLALTVDALSALPCRPLHCVWRRPLWVAPSQSFSRSHCVAPCSLFVQGCAGCTTTAPAEHKPNIT